jgi:hypothetical protein
LDCRLTLSRSQVHESLQHDLFPAHLQASGATEASRTLALAMRASHYYLAALLPVRASAITGTGEAAPTTAPSSRADRFACYACGFAACCSRSVTNASLPCWGMGRCFAKTPRLRVDDWPLPASVTDLMAWRASVLQRLGEDGCLPPRDAGIPAISSTSPAR